ncbi:MAG: hypothetical protein L6R40_007467 [Gallowayella cf. fulva]|nr:MAG: hypothetical protein L6R40_007467 [Xanthomendoza cf. fulva]
MIQGFDATCLRHDGAYPVLLNGHLQPRPSRFNFVACSGDNFPTILQKQLKPSYMRPRWGDRPEFVTLSMGGNDIGFKELVTLCVYSIPNPMSPLMDCADAIARSQRLVNSPDFVGDAINVIISILRKGADTGVPNLKIYVTGFAQFFNERTTQCNSVNFRPEWLKLMLKPKQYLTVDRRRTLNKIARDLNAGLREAVMRASFGAPNRVFFIDYDRAFDGHRFCDRVEPNPNDVDTWFFTYGADQAAIGDFLDSIPQIHDVFSGHSNRTMSYDTLFRLVLDATADDKEKNDMLVGLTRIFHPKLDGQRAIERRLRNVVLATRSLEVPTSTTEVSES